MNRAVDGRTAIFGEVGLGGEIRSVTSADARIAEARQLGFERVILPEGNRDATSAEGMTLVPVSRVDAALEALW